MQAVEVFYIGDFEINHLKMLHSYEKPGWYWWYCHPGCLPDSEPYGPYISAQAAQEAANEDRLS